MVFLLIVLKMDMKLNKNSKVKYFCTKPMGFLFLFLFFVFHDINASNDYKKLKLRMEFTFFLKKITIFKLIWTKQNLVRFECSY